MDSLIRRLDRWLSAHRPKLYAVLKPGATDAQIETFRSKLGVSPPDDLVALLRWRNGQSADPPAFQYNRELLGTESILSDREMYSELLEGGDIEQWDAGWIPFLRSGGGDVVCINADGEIFERSSDDEVDCIDYPSLRCWLQVFVETLEAGLWDNSGDLQPTDHSAITAHTKKVAPGYPKNA